MRDSTNPACRSTRRCLETDGCESRSLRSISPTERSDESSRLKMARRLGSATMANDDSTMNPLGLRFLRSFRLGSLRLAGAVEGDRLANERLEGGRVHLFSFV